MKPDFWMGMFAAFGLVCAVVCVCLAFGQVMVWQLRRSEKRNAERTKVNLGPVNFAWAHPVTGERNQTIVREEPAMLAEARFRAWEQLHGPCQESICGHPFASHGRFGSCLIDRCQCGRYSPAGPDKCVIWRQTAIGNVSTMGPFVDPFRVLEVDKARGGELGPGNPYSFAYADPETAARVVLPSFPGDNVKERLIRLQNEKKPQSEVVVYATWEEFTVSRDDPRPPPPPPQEYRTADDRPGQSAYDSRRAVLESITVLDDSTKVACVSAWALLDIAESLEARYRSRTNPPRRPRRYRADPAPRRTWRQGFKRMLFGEMLSPAECPVDLPPPAPDSSQLPEPSPHKFQAPRGHNHSGDCSE